MNPLSFISGKYSKFIVALAGVAVVGIQTFYGSNSPTVSTIVAGISALLVYLVPNSSSAGINNDHVG